MGGNPIVAMRFDAMIDLAGLLCWIDMDNCAGKELQMMPKLVLQLPALSEKHRESFAQAKSNPGRSC